MDDLYWWVQEHWPLTLILVGVVVLILVPVAWWRMTSVTRSDEYVVRQESGKRIE